MDGKDTVQQITTQSTLSKEELSALQQASGNSTKPTSFIKKVLVTYLIWIWGLSPAITLWIDGMFRPQPILSPLTTTPLHDVAFIGAPFVLYGWSAFYLRRLGTDRWWLAAIPLGLLMTFINLLGFIVI